MTKKNKTSETQAQCAIQNVVCSASAEPQYCNDCKNYPPNTQEKHKKCKECYFIGNQQSNFEPE